MFDPTVIANAGQIIRSIEEFLGIGGGRREAVQITPIQNQIHYNVLAPVSAFLDTPIANQQYEDLQAALKVLTDTEAGWLAFLRNTDWSDGRAAIQAQATLDPYFREFTSEIRNKLASMPEPWFPDEGEVPGVIPVYPPGYEPPIYTTAPPSTASMPWWLLPGLAIGAIFLMSRTPARRY